MSEKVVPFPIPPSQRVSFSMGGQMHFLIIPAPARRKPKRAEVIPISTTVSQAGEATGATFTIGNENKVAARGSGVEAEQNAAALVAHAHIRS